MDPYGEGSFDDELYEGFPPEGATVAATASQGRLESAIFRKVAAVRYMSFLPCHAGFRILTSVKLIKAATILQIPIHSTVTQVSEVGPLCPEVAQYLKRATKAHPTIERRQTSMAVNPILSLLPTQPSAIAIVGVQAHAGVAHTALDLLARGYKVYVIADGVSSRHKEEIPIAMRRLEKEGAIITTSDAWMYELMPERGEAEYSRLWHLMGEYTMGTKMALETLCPL